MDNLSTPPTEKSLQKDEVVTRSASTSKTKPTQEYHDTWAVFLAAIQVIGPVILLMVGVVLGAYGILHLLFLR